MRGTHMFILKEDTHVIGTFIQPSIKISPQALNETSIEITIADILKIQRIDDANWAPPKFKYFIFELSDSTQLTGKPLEKGCIIRSSILKRCMIDFTNLVKVERLKQNSQS